MYDRLEEIYGLGKFNFGGEEAIYKSIGVNDDGDEKEDDSAGSSLFDDILSVFMSLKKTAYLLVNLYILKVVYPLFYQS